jgi:hypothetical protein
LVKTIKFNKNRGLGIADDDLLTRLIRVDYDTLLTNNELDTSPEVKGLILLQSIEGHAHNGHGVFHKRRFVNLSTADVVRSLGLNENQVKSDRQTLIDEVFEWVDLVLQKEPLNRLVNRREQPLFRIPLLARLEVDAADILRGIYLGGLRDDSDVRLEVEKKYNIPIGGGACYLVNTRVMNKMGLNAEELASGSFADDIEYFRNVGLIEDKPKVIDDNVIRYMYIRHRIGPGHSDDAAMVATGLLWGRDTALGAFLADAIDTIEKYSYKYQDQDSELANYIGEKFELLKVGTEELQTLTYLAAVPVGKEEYIPDSSFRYFITIDQKTRMTMLASHIGFIEGKPYISINTGHHRTSTDEFYLYMSKRVMDFTKKPVPVTARISEVGAPLSVVLERNFVTTNMDSTVDEVAKAMVKASSDLAVVTDEQGKVVGVIRGSKLLPFLTAEPREKPAIEPEE